MISTELTHRLAQTGIVSGFVGFACYFAAAFLPLPDKASFVLAAHFGLGLSVGFIGIYYFFRWEGYDSVALRLSCLFGATAGVMVTAMIIVQQTIFSLRDIRLAQQSGEAEKTLTKQIFRELNSVHLGLDIAWDVLISWAGVALGVAMLSHPKFGKIWGTIGIVVSAALLVLNMATFPIPPGEAGLIDLGPFAAVFYGAVFVQMARFLWPRAKRS